MSTDAGDLGRQVKSGLRWSLVNTALGRAGTFISGIALARILAPRDFGVFAVALVVMQLLLSLNDIGVSACLIRWQGDIDEVAPTGTTVILLASALLFAGMYVAAPWFAEAVRVPASTGVVRLLCAGVLIDGIFAVPSALVTRDMRQDLRTRSDMSVFVVSTGLTLLLAVLGAGPWSLAWGRLAGNLVGGVSILAFSGHRIRPGWNRSVVGHVVGFGLPLTGSSLLLFGMLNIDSIVVGRVLGATALGLYALAFNLSSWPVNILSETIRRVSLAAFARLHGSEGAVEDGMLRSSALLVAVTVPICGLLAVVATPLIGFLYGDRWLPAASVLRYLAALGGCRVFAELVSDYLTARGHARTILAVQAWWVAALIPALIIGAHLDGIVGVGIGHMVVAAGLVLPVYLWVTRRTGVSMRALAGLVARPLLAAGAGLGGAIAAVTVMPGRLLSLLVAGVVGVAVYAAIVYPGRRRLMGMPAG